MNWSKTLSIAVGIAASIVINPLLGQQINWYSDLDAAKRIAVAENKPILVHFAASWCRPCQHLEKFVFNHAQIVREVNEGFVAVKLDVDTYPGIAKQFQTERVPMDVILNTNGQVIKKRLSPDSVDNYLAMLRDTRPVAIQSTQPQEQTIIAQRDQLQDRWSELQVAKQQQTTPLGGAEFKIPEFAQSTQSFESNKPIENLAAREMPPPGAFASSHELKPNASMFQTNLQVQPMNPAAPMASDANRSDFQATSPTPPATNNQLRANPLGNNTVAENTNSNRPIANPFANTPASAVATRGEDDQLLFDHGNSNIAAISPPAQSPPGQSPLSVAPPAAAPLTQTQNALVGTHATGNGFGQNVNGQVVSPPPSTAVVGNSTVTQPATTSTNPSQPLGLNGDCPVSLLLDNQWVPGKREWVCQHRGKLYLFASAEYLAKFQTDPDGFSPLLGGFDPVIYHEQQQWVDGLREHGVFMTKEGQQSVVLFRDQQTRQKFRDEPAKYLETIRKATAAKSANPIR